MRRSWLRITGTVQGVGFRPFVHRLADRLELTGAVGNDADGVWCEVQGPELVLEAFVARVRDEAPPLAQVDSVEVRAMALRPGEAAFEIADSDLREGEVSMSVPPDVAPCKACLAEIETPGDRRHGYAFTCCTDCGPRYTVIRGLPYDRERTSMAAFGLCAECCAEYCDPADRRYHAEAVCCPQCGPTLTLRINGTAVAGDPILGAAKCIAAGGIVTLKGAGGYQLVCRADREQSVARLRARKRREEKPFALLVPGIAAARRLAELDAVAEAALASPAAPIVLVPRRVDGEGGIASSVAPATRLLGVMLPATPLHALLAEQAGCDALVCTSGNLSDEPIVIDDDEAERRLGPMCDAVLSHDRRIERRADDSVTQAVAGELQLLRRARGLAPRPIRMTGSGPTLLAVGAELKSTVCLAVGDSAHLSVHLGDLEHPAALEAFETAVADLLTMAQAVPDLVVHDAHPEYLSTKFALAAGLAPAESAQHHHAHLASCLEDNAWGERAVGVIFDGLGWGSDGTLWGGEFLVGDAAAVERAAHLDAVPMPGGNTAIKEPWRMAVAHLHKAFAGCLPELSFLDRHHNEIPAVAAQCEADRGLSTSSVGRLFDAVAALCGLGDFARYEGQAAQRLEQAAGSPEARYPVGLIEGMPLRVDVADLIAAVVADLEAGTSAGSIAGAFHRWLADVIVLVSARLAEESGLRTVALSGGVFQNRLLSELAVAGLSNERLRVLRHRQVPPNDGGIALGQAAIGRALLSRGD